jgi:hypothetical protein
MCGLSWEWVLVIVFVDLFLFGIVIVNFVNNVKETRKALKAEQARLYNPPPKWFVDQWIAQNCPVSGQNQSDMGSLFMLFFVFAALIAMVYLIFW